MWWSHLFWKLFLVLGGLNLALALIFLGIVTAAQRNEVHRQVEHRLFTAAVLLRSHVRELVDDITNADEPNRRNSLERLQAVVQRLAAESDTRMTIVAADGQVLADSAHDPKTMVNHANRPELIAAAESGKGTAMRASPTLQVDMSYLSLPIYPHAKSSAQVRVAVELSTIHQRLATMYRFLWLLAFAFAIFAMGTTYFLVRRVTTPLAQLTERAQAIAAGTEQYPVLVHGHDEVGQLAEAFNQMQSELAKRFRQLRENNEQMSTVLASMDQGIVAIDTEQRIVLANDASKEFLNFTIDNAVGRPLLEAVRNRTLHDVVQKCLEKGAPVQAEFESLTRRRRDLVARAIPLPGPSKFGVVIVLHDITELRRLENVRRDFVANVSHELKTPLASIKAYAETLRLGAVNDPEHNMRFIDRIEEQAERLHQLILDMLHIARVESGKEAFDITEVSISEAVEACRIQHAETARRKDIEWMIHPPETELYALADEDGFNTILDNLVVNAIKYTPPGGRVSLRWWGEGEYVTIEVADTGIGIAAEDQTRVFERFFRADRARSRDLGGTGLGLSIVKHLCQAFGGSVNLQSQLGQGSRLRICLPAAHLPP